MVDEFIGTGIVGYSKENIRATTAALVPTSVWVDSNGNIFTIHGGYRISKISSGSNNITTIAGTLRAGDGNSPTLAFSSTLYATAVKILTPVDIWGDSLGFLYYLDSGYGFVGKISPVTNQLTRVMGPCYAFSPDNTTASSACVLAGVSFTGDSTGSIYIGEASQPRVRRVSSVTWKLLTVAGNGVAAFAGDNGPATSASLSYPIGLFVDSLGNIFFADGARVRKVTKSTGIIRTFAGTGSGGFNGDNIIATLARMITPNSIWADTMGNVFIEDMYQRVRVVSAATGNMSTAAGGIGYGFTGDGGAATLATTSYLNDIWGDSNGNLFIADTRNYRIRKVSAAGTPSAIITTVVGSGLCYGLGDGQPASSIQIDTPAGYWINTNGETFFMEAKNYFAKIRKVNATGIVSSVVGSGKLGYSADGTALSSAYLNALYGITGDTLGNLYFMDNNLLRMIALGASSFSTVAGGGSSTAANVSATAYSFGAVKSLWMDSVGRIFISLSAGNQVRAFLTTSRRVVLVAGTGATSPAVDNAPATQATVNIPMVTWGDTLGNLFILEGGLCSIRRIDATSGIIARYAGTGSCGPSTLDGKAATLTPLYYPNGLAGDSFGNLFVAETSRYLRKISRVNATSSLVVSTILAATGGLYNIGYGRQLAYPAAMSPGPLQMDSNGVLFLAEQTGKRIRRLYQTAEPTGQPSSQPSAQPSRRPSRQPTAQPTGRPSRQPSSRPTTQPTCQPTGRPSSLYFSTSRTAVWQLDNSIGSGILGDTRPGPVPASAAFLYPQSIFGDSLGRLYAASTYRISLIDAIGPDHNVTAFLGTAVSATGSQAENVAATATRVLNVADFWVDSAGNLFYADNVAAKIRRVDAASGRVTTILGAFKGFSPDNTTAAVAGNSGTLSLYGDSAGDLFFTEGNRIRRLPMPTQRLVTVAGSSSASFSGDGGPASSALLNGPMSLRIDSAGDLFFADYYNVRLRRISRATGIISTILGTGQAVAFPTIAAPPAITTASNTIAMNFCPTLWVTSAGDLFFAAASRVYRIEAGTGRMSVAVGTGLRGFSGDGGNATAAQIGPITDLWGDTTGALFVTDKAAYRLRRVSPAGIITTAAGVGRFTDHGDGLPATAAQFTGPSMWLDSGGAAYVLDYGSLYAKLWRLTPDPATLPLGSLGPARFLATTLAGTGVQGLSPDGTALTASQLSGIFAITGDAAGNLYLLDNGLLRLIPAGGSAMTTLAGGGTSSAENVTATTASFTAAVYLAADPDGGFVFASFVSLHKIRAVGLGPGLSLPATSRRVNTIAGTGAATPFLDDRPPLTATLNNPNGLWLDSAGALYVADSSNHRVRRLTRDGRSGRFTHILTLAGNGQTAYNGEDLAATASALAFPSAVSVDTIGRVFVTVSGDNRLVQLTPNSPGPDGNGNGNVSYTATTIIGSRGAAEVRVGRQEARAADMQPLFHWMDGRGRLFIKENYANWIRVAFLVDGPTSQPSAQPTARPSRLPSSLPSTRPTAQPSAGPSSLPSQWPSSRPTSQPLTVPSSAPTGQPTSRPSSAPSACPASQPTALPSAQPSSRPSLAPTCRPSHLPTGTPSNSPSTTPSAQPSAQPTARPSQLPSSLPSPRPTAQPSAGPSATPSTAPSSGPSVWPSGEPSAAPSRLPSDKPTAQPSAGPSSWPSSRPTSQPSALPSSWPSGWPSSLPSLRPSLSPSSRPSVEPSALPSQRPSSQPSSSPTAYPSARPSCLPSAWPSNEPSSLPSAQPTALPTRWPTERPSGSPSSWPSARPSCSPSAGPSVTPSHQPSAQPSAGPSQQPIRMTARPTELPSRGPTSSHPTRRPYASPSASPNTPALPARPVSFLPAAGDRVSGRLTMLGRFLPPSGAAGVFQSTATAVDLGPSLGSLAVLFGRADFPATLELAEAVADGSLLPLPSPLSGAWSPGQAGLFADVVSRAVEAVGDINGDGLGDFLLCDPLAAACFGFLGTGNPPSPSAFRDLRPSFELRGTDAAGPIAGLGWAVAGLGDLDGDGCDDFLVTAAASSAAFLIFGRRSFPRLLGLSLAASATSSSSSSEVVVLRAERLISFGLAAAGQGDFDGDGLADLAVTGLQSTGSSSQAVVLLLSGRALLAATSSPSSSLLVDDPNPSPANPSSSATAWAVQRLLAPPATFGGLSLALLGDANGDGLADLAVSCVPFGGREGEEAAARVFLVYGRPSFFAASDGLPLLLANLSRADGLALVGAGGFFVAPAGDLDGDGLADLLLADLPDWRGRGNSFLLVRPANLSRPSQRPSARPTGRPSLSSAPSRPTPLPSSLPPGLTSPVPTRRPQQSSRPRSAVPSPPPTALRTLRPSAAPVPTSSRPSSTEPTFRPSPAPSADLRPQLGNLTTVAVACTSSADCASQLAAYAAEAVNFHFIITQRRPRYGPIDVGPGTASGVVELAGGRWLNLFTLRPCCGPGVVGPALTLRLPAFQSGRDQLDLRPFAGLGLTSRDGLSFSSRPLVLRLAPGLAVSFPAVEQLDELAAVDFLFAAATDSDDGPSNGPGLRLGGLTAGAVAAAVLLAVWVGCSLSLARPSSLRLTKRAAPALAPVPAPGTGQGQGVGAEELGDGEREAASSSASSLSWELSSEEEEDVDGEN